MKNRYSAFFATLLLLLSSSIVYSQWSTDPLNPGIVCNASGTQKNVVAFEDGNGGVFVFWLDSRNGTGSTARDVFGQHYDASGYALWETNGRQILSHRNKIPMFQAKRFDNGEIIIGWTTAGSTSADSLNFQKLDDNGAKVWNQDLTAACYTSQIHLSITGFSLILDATGYVVKIEAVYTGGSNGNRITRFSSEGMLTGLLNGEPEGTQYNFGSSGLLSTLDGTNDIYLYYSGGNGAGAGLYCLRVNSAGDTIWGPSNMIEGTSGLSYQFDAFSDPAGITFVWQGNGVNAENLYARRYNGNGSMAWGSTPLPICVADGKQTNFFCRQSEDNYFITWADGRPGTSPGYYDIYAQKFDISGNLLWLTDGVQVASFNTYSPYPQFGFTTDGKMIVCHQSTTVGFNAQLLNTDGTLPWAPGGYSICDKSFNPFYQDHTEVTSGNSVITVWARSTSNGADDVYITRVVNSAVSLPEPISEEMSLFPNPATDKITLQSPAMESVRNISIFSSSGHLIQTFSVSSPKENEDELELDIHNLTAGYYRMILETEKGRLNRSFLKIR